MINIVLVIVFLAAGITLGVLYFGGLWLTVQRVVDGRWPTSMLLVSFIGRAGFLLAGFYVLLQAGGGQWESLALSVLGFMGARLAMQRVLSPAASLSRGNQEHRIADGSIG